MKRAIVFLLTVTVFSILVLAGCAAREQTTLENRVKSGGSGAISSQDVELQRGVEPSKETGALPDRALIKTFSMTLRAERSNASQKAQSRLRPGMADTFSRKTTGPRAAGPLRTRRVLKGPARLATSSRHISSSEFLPIV